ncbi:protein kinase [Myxococcota bacterium]
MPAPARESRRVPLSVRVVRHDGGAPGGWTSVNMSEGGMFVTGSPILSPGTQLTVGVSLPVDQADDTELVTGGRVVWTNDPNNPSSPRLPAGMGIQFHDLDSDSRRILRSSLYGTSQSLPVEPPKELEPGTTIGSYRIHDKLGEGGTSCVYLAEHLDLGRMVALKRLHPHSSTDRDAVRRFFDEGRLVNRIKHDNVVEITDFISEGTDKYYVMELLDGTPLSRVLAGESPLSLGRAMAIAAQVCEALVAVHEAGIVHRDLKPANIIVIERNGEPDFVKLLDFGIAKLKLPNGSLDQTAPGVVVGTPTHIAPEYSLGRKADHRADIYSLGVLLYQLVTGQPVFASDSWAEILLSHVNDKPRPPSQLRPGGLPRRLNQLILKCLEKKPASRPESARQVGEQIREIAAALEADALPLVEAEPDSPWLALTRAPRRAVVVALMVALVVILSLVVFVASGTNDTSADVSVSPSSSSDAEGSAPDTQPGNLDSTSSLRVEAGGTVGDVGQDGCTEEVGPSRGEFEPPYDLDKVKRTPRHKRLLYRRGTIDPFAE